MNDGNTVRVHWSFWAIVAIGLVYNLAGVANFVSQLNPEVVAAMPEPYRALIEGRPAWATGAFALAVVGGALGCLLLLFRKSAANYVFMASLLGGIVTMIHALSAGAASGALIGNLVQLVVTALLLGYTVRSERVGWVG